LLPVADLALLNLNDYTGNELMLSPRSAQRIQTIPETIFTTMSRLALQHNAVNLGQGFPDFDGPAWIVDEAFAAMKAGKNQYAPMNGTQTLRHAIRGLYKNFYDYDINPDTEITVCAGATEALYSTIMALIEPGDEALMFEPFYDAHQADVLLAGGCPKYVTLHKPDFHFNPDELEAAITPRTKLFILNNPQNPLGKVFTSDELNIIAELAKKHNLLVISDEVYEFLTFDGAKHLPIATLPGMKERTITISSTGKTFGMTGWKIGYAVAVPELTAAIQKIHQFTTFAVNTPGQIAMGHAINKLEEYLPEFRSLYKAKRDMLYDGLKETVFAAHMPQGSYFMMIDLPESNDADDVVWARKLVEQQGIATIPPSVFYGNSSEGKSMLRLCFAKSDETLRQGIEKLRGVA
jgi:N-succinyldiaminopimelate aminotransferase